MHVGQPELLHHLRQEQQETKACGDDAEIVQGKDEHFGFEELGTSNKKYPQKKAPAAGLVIAGMTLGTAWAVVGMTIATIGLYGSKGPFWTMPSMFLTGSAAASGIAWINGIGNLGGFFGPTAVGWIKTMTGSFSSGLYLLAGMAVVSAVSTFWLDIKNPVAERELAGVPAE